MGRSNVKGLILVLLLVLLFATTSFDTCVARKGRHWRSSGFTLIKKKIKGKSSHSWHHHHGHNAGSSYGKKHQPGNSTPIPSPSQEPLVPSPAVNPIPISDKTKPRSGANLAPSPKFKSSPSPKHSPIPSPVSSPAPSSSHKSKHGPSPKPSPVPSPAPSPISKPGSSHNPKPAPSPAPSPKTNPKLKPKPNPSPKPKPGPSPSPTPIPSPAHKTKPSPSPVPSPQPSPGHKSKPSPSPSPKPSPISPPSGQTKTYNVLNFGANGDGKTDDTKAFQAAWLAVCKVQSSTLLVPARYQFLVGPISFAGPNCQPGIVFQLDGTIVAPTNAKAWGSGLLQWLEFTKLKSITIQGSGTIEGSGSVWWGASQLDEPIGAELAGGMPSTKPTALRFYGSSDVIVTGITIQNSPQCHLKFDSCSGVQVYGITVSSPGDSPNTDGIHLQESSNVVVHHNQLSCGDDCVSIQTGCSNINIHHVTCGPGHGISIGGLGKDNTKACVSNVTVQNVNLQGTMTGVRIKTWQGGSGSVQNIRFSNIQVTGVQIPIMIDQFYCDKSSCKNQSSAVAVSSISYDTIKGSYTVKPVHLACSDASPCSGITLSDIELQAQQQRSHLSDPFCWNAYGTMQSPILPPVDCLQKGKASKNPLQSSMVTC